MREVGFPIAVRMQPIFGDLHTSGEDAAKFYAESKIVVAR